VRGIIATADIIEHYLQYLLIVEEFSMTMTLQDFLKNIAHNESAVLLSLLVSGNIATADMVGVPDIINTLWMAFW
jgi:uncharacterized protein with HEPN domain